MWYSTVEEKYGQIYDYFEDKRQEKNFEVFNEKFHEDGMEDTVIPRSGGPQGLKDYLETYVDEDGWGRCLTALRQRDHGSKTINVSREVKEELEALKASYESFDKVIRRLLEHYENKDEATVSS